MRSASRTVKNGSNTSSCGTTPSSRRAAAYSDWTSWPSTATRPALARARPARMLISVVLPAPFGPSRPKNSPCAMSNETSSSARTSPRGEVYVLATLANETAGMARTIVGTEGWTHRGAVLDCPATKASMASQTKKPRKTAERILDTTLELFNRFGEPNVSTTLISAELGISPGNLYYHYPAKEGLILKLYDRYDAALTELLRAADDVRDVEDAWLFFHMLFELIWSYRFLYRDLNDLLSNHRKLETHFKFVLERKTRAVQAVLDGLAGGKGRAIAGRDAEPVATSMVVVLTYWLSFEYVRDPRHALEPEAASAALLRGAFHVLGLLAPYLDSGQREHLDALAARYANTDDRG